MFSPPCTRRSEGVGEIRDGVFSPPPPSRKEVSVKRGGGERGSRPQLRGGLLIP